MITSAAISSQSVSARVAGSGVGGFFGLGVVAGNGAGGSNGLVENGVLTCEADVMNSYVLESRDGVLLSVNVKLPFSIDGVSVTAGEAVSLDVNLPKGSRALLKSMRYASVPFVPISDNVLSYSCSCVL